MKIINNAVVTLEFKVYDRESHELLEDTQDVGPFMYIQGIGAFVPKIEEFLMGKEKGFKGNLDLDMEEAYGDYDEDLLEEMKRYDFEEFDDIYEGMEFVAEMDDGSEVIYTVTEVDGDKIMTDGNHPFAGRNLTFEVLVTGVREASEEELEHGHVHFHGFED